MRIKWSGEAAEAVIARLTSAIEAAELQLTKASEITALLEECDPDGENKAMQKARMLFEGEKKRLKKLVIRLNETLDATERATLLFEEAEAGNARLWDSIDTGRKMDRDNGSSYGPAGSPTDYSFIPMTSVRRRNCPMPPWIELMADRPLIIDELVEAHNPMSA